MREHPLTPMTDANLVRVLQAQLDRAAARRVGLHRLPRPSPSRPPLSRHPHRPAPLPKALRIAIVDALGNDDLMRLGAAVKNLSVVCAGSGLALGLPANWGITPPRPKQRACRCQRAAGRSSPAVARARHGAQVFALHRGRRRGPTQSTR